MPHATPTLRYPPAADTADLDTLVADLEEGWGQDPASRLAEVTRRYYADLTAEYAARHAVKVCPVFRLITGRAG